MSSCVFCVFLACVFWLCSSAFFLLLDLCSAFSGLRIWFLVFPSSFVAFVLLCLSGFPALREKQSRLLGFCLRERKNDKIRGRSKAQGRRGGRIPNKERIGSHRCSWLLICRLLRIVTCLAYCILSFLGFAASPVACLPDGSCVVWFPGYPCLAWCPCFPWLSSWYQIPCLAWLRRFLCLAVSPFQCFLLSCIFFRSSWFPVRLAFLSLVSGYSVLVPCLFTVCCFSSHVLVCCVRVQCFTVSPVYTSLISFCLCMFLCLLSCFLFLLCRVFLFPVALYLVCCVLFLVSPFSSLSRLCCSLSFPVLTFLLSFVLCLVSGFPVFLQRKLGTRESKKQQTRNKKAAGTTANRGTGPSSETQE